MNWECHGVPATIAAGSELAGELGSGDIIALVGGLGMGKTHFTKGIALGLGHSGEVTSPTFSLAHEYLDGRLPLFHFDFYRLEEEAEALRIGWEDYLDEDGILVIEWADRLPALLPDTARWIHFAAGSEEGSRTLTEKPAPRHG